MGFKGLMRTAIADHRRVMKAREREARQREKLQANLDKEARQEEIRQAVAEYTFDFESLDLKFVYCDRGLGANFRLRGETL